MTEDDTPEIESSPLCTSGTREGITVRVEIFRLAGSGEGWSFEVVDRYGGSTVCGAICSPPTETPMPSLLSNSEDGRHSLDLPEVRWDDHIRLFLVAELNSEMPRKLQIALLELSRRFPSGSI